jgi:colanic acid/amylovoran biosynthesis glycosyltransferase
VTEGRSPPGARDVERTGRIAYVVSWFPAITETFILEEVLELRARGVPVEVFPLFGSRGGDVHAAWSTLEPWTHFHANLSWELVAAQLHWLRRRPGTYLRAWTEALLRSAPSPKLLVRAPFVVAKAALLARRIETLGVEHVHAHWATHPTLAAWVIEALTGIGYSFTTHAHDLYVDNAMLREKVKGARFVVTISEFNRAFVADRCGECAAGKVHVVRCGVDLAAFAPRGRRQVPVPTFVCVAGLREYKGHDVLLDACRLLRDRGVDARLRLVGDGPLRRHLEARLAREGLRDRVELLGALPHERIPDALEGVTAMVLPSVRTRDGQMEGIPVALMEAMAAGVPVVSTRLSGIPELVEDGESGLLVPERDASALADALERLAGDAALGARLAESAQRIVRERFDRARNVAVLHWLLAARVASPADAAETAATAATAATAETAETAEATATAETADTAGAAAQPAARAG